MAEGLLVVVFRPDVTPERRAALVKEAGGSLAGPAGMGGHYITLPPAGTADATADRLIRLDGVTSVGGTACPPPPPPPAPAPPPVADSAARPDTAAAADTAARADSAAPAAPPPAAPAVIR